MLKVVPAEMEDCVTNATECVTSCPVCTQSRLTLLDTKVSLCRCDACGLMFRNPRPTESAIAQYYSKDEQYDDWLAHESSRDALWLRRLQMVNRYGRRGRLLDVGTGIGQFLHFAQLNYEVTGTELSARAIQIARAKYDLEIQHGTLDKIEFGERRFEVITLFHVLEHVHEPRRLLSRCGDLLSPTGVVVVAVPNEIHGWKRPFKSAFALAGRSLPDTSTRYGLTPIGLNSPGEEIHLTHFTRGTLRVLFDLCGLRVIDEDLDPCHASAGAKQLVHEIAFRTCKALHSALGLQLGEAIWMAADKTLSTSANAN